MLARCYQNLRSKNSEESTVKSLSIVFLVISALPNFSYSSEVTYRPGRDPQTTEVLIQDRKGDSNVDAQRFYAYFEVSSDAQNLGRKLLTVGNITLRCDAQTIIEGKVADLANCSFLMAAGPQFKESGKALIYNEGYGENGMTLGTVFPPTDDDDFNFKTADHRLTIGTSNGVAFQLEYNK